MLRVTEPSAHGQYRSALGNEQNGSVLTVDSHTLQASAWRTVSSSLSGSECLVDCIKQLVSGLLFLHKFDKFGSLQRLSWRREDDPCAIFKDRRLVNIWHIRMHHGLIPKVRHVSVSTLLFCTPFNLQWTSIGVVPCEVLQVSLHTGS